MSGIAFGIVAAAALIHASWNFPAKKVTVKLSLSGGRCS
jgi:hypothetical protein